MWFLSFLCHFRLIHLHNGTQYTEVRGITNRKTVLEGYENVQAALLDYTLTCYPSVEVSEAVIISDYFHF